MFENSTYTIVQSINDYKASCTKSNVSQREKNKSNIIADMTFSHIMYTNQSYQNKMNKSKTKDSSPATQFNSVDDLNDFISKEASVQKKKNSWKQMPFNWQIDLCKEFLQSDSSISPQEADAYLSKLRTHKDLLKHVSYDKFASKVKKIDYSYLR